MKQKKFTEKTISDLLLGIAVGDAMGVPFEFLTREALDQQPVQDITGWAMHEQPPGTYSDDTALTLCLAESMAEGLDIEELGKKMCDWFRKGYWSAHGEVFDIGIGTRIALQKILSGSPTVMAGGDKDMDNGNGSLMRIAPLALDSRYREPQTLWNTIEAVSSITHRHVRSHIACFIWVIYLQELLKGDDKRKAYENMRIQVNLFFDQHTLPVRERELFDRLLVHDIQQIDRSVINSGGYVLDTLEAAFWCFLNTQQYDAAILLGINLGRDTDTTAAVIGAAAGLYYGMENIPAHWSEALARRDDIEALSEKLFHTLSSHSQQTHP